MGKGKRTNDGILRVLHANVGVWLTTKEIGWIMRQICGYSASGKSICRRLNGLEYLPVEERGNGHIEVGKLSKVESYYFKCKFKYRWVED